MRGRMPGLLGGNPLHQKHKTENGTGKTPPYCELYVCLQTHPSRPPSRCRNAASVRRGRMPGLLGGSPLKKHKRKTEREKPPILRAVRMLTNPFVEASFSLQKCSKCKERENAWASWRKPPQETQTENGKGKPPVLRAVRMLTNPSVEISFSLQKCSKCKERENARASWRNSPPLRY
jgi:hypothetical protein